MKELSKNYVVPTFYSNFNMLKKMYRLYDVNYYTWIWYRKS